MKMHQIRFPPSGVIPLSELWQPVNPLKVVLKKCFVGVMLGDIFCFFSLPADVPQLDVLRN